MRGFELFPWARREQAATALEAARPELVALLDLVREFGGPELATEIAGLIAVVERSSARLEVIAEAVEALSEPFEEARRAEKDKALRERTERERAKALELMATMLTDSKPRWRSQ